MSIQRAISGGLRVLERQLSPDGLGVQTFTWKNKEIECTPSTLARGTQLDIGGHLEEIDFTLHVRRDRFLTVDTSLITVDSELLTTDDDRPTPVAGKTLIFRGRTMRILRAAEDGSRAYFRLDLGSKDR